MQHQEHFGKKFYLDKKTGYWISTATPRIRAHRWVWTCSHGAIPKGHHIHHIDGNKSNNCISNLEILQSREHLSRHMTPERREAAAMWASKIRPLTKEWHRSLEGKEWHRMHAYRSLPTVIGKIYPMSCQNCSKHFNGKKKGQTFCSNACKSSFRRNSGVDNVNRNCENCQTSYRVNRYAKRRFCSRVCSNTLYLKVRKSRRVLPFCTEQPEHDC